jgi:hypothetical protein
MTKGERVLIDPYGDRVNYNNPMEINFTME